MERYQTYYSIDAARLTASVGRVRHSLKLWGDNKKPMSSFIDRLEAFRVAHAEHFDSQTIPLEECLSLYREYVATGKYPYLEDVANYAQEKLNLSAEWHDTLHSQAYFCAQFEREREKKEKIEKMVSEGWTRITHNIQETLKPGMKVDLHFTSSQDWFSLKKELEGCRVVEDRNGGLFFLPKGKRSRGYSSWKLAIDGESFYRLSSKGIPMRNMRDLDRVMLG